MSSLGKKFFSSEKCEEYSETQESVKILGRAIRYNSGNKPFTTGSVSNIIRYRELFQKIRFSLEQIAALCLYNI